MRLLANIFIVMLIPCIAVAVDYPPFYRLPLSDSIYSGGSNAWVTVIDDVHPWIQLQQAAQERKVGGSNTAYVMFSERFDVYAGTTNLIGDGWTNTYIVQTNILVNDAGE